MNINSSARDRRNLVLADAFTQREVDERMEVLLDEIEKAKYTLCDSKLNLEDMKAFQSRRVLLLTNLLSKVKERLKRDDIKVK